MTLRNYAAPCLWDFWEANFQRNYVTIIEVLAINGIQIGIQAGLGALEYRFQSFSAKGQRCCSSGAQRHPKLAKVASGVGKVCEHVAEIAPKAVKKKETVVGMSSSAFISCA